MACFAFSSRLLLADTPAVAITPGSTSQVPVSETYGWSFSLSHAVSLTQLGVYDARGTGFTESHKVTIWDSTGLIALAQVTVPSFNAAPIVGGFRYVMLSLPVMLPAGNYVIGAYYQFITPPDRVVDASSIISASGITYTGARSRTGDGFPAGDIYPTANAWFGANFQFNNLAVGPVPESGATLAPRCGRCRPRGTAAEVELLAAPLFSFTAEDPTDWCLPFCA